MCLLGRGEGAGPKRGPVLKTAAGMDSGGDDMQGQHQHESSRIARRFEFQSFVLFKLKMEKRAGGGEGASTRRCGLMAGRALSAPCTPRWMVRQHAQVREHVTALGRLTGSRGPAGSKRAAVRAATAVVQAR